VNAQAAANIASLKKAEMAERAEALLAGTGWLPTLLRG
jgi:ParB family chromosome partitioning protein